MFLAGKVEETPRPLKDVILVSYEIIHKKDPAAAQRIKQKVAYQLIIIVLVLAFLYMVLRSFFYGDSDLCTIIFHLYCSPQVLKNLLYALLLLSSCLL